MPLIFYFLLLFSSLSYAVAPSPTYMVNGVSFGDIKTACEAAAGYKAEVNFGAGAYFAKRELLSGVHGYGTCMLIDASGRAYSINEGTWSYGVPSCPANTSMDATGQCMASCPDQGTAKSIVLPAGTVLGATGYIADVQGCGYMISPQTPNAHGLCTTSSPNSSSSNGSVAGITYCNRWIASSVGGAIPNNVNGIITVDPGLTSVSMADSTAPVPPGSGQKCQYNNNEQVLCTGGNLPAGTSTIDGVSVTPNTIDNKPSTPDSPKPCQNTGAGVLCSVAPGDSNSNACITNSAGVQSCYSSTPTTKTTAPITTVNPDGTVTKTTVTSDNVSGNTPVTTSETCTGAGSCSTVTNGSTSSQRLTQIANNTAAASKAAAQQADCVLDPNTIGCMQQGAAGANDVLTTTDALGGLSAFTYSSLGSSGGNCPVPESFTLSVMSWSKTYSISYSYICSFAGLAKPVVISMALLSAAFIILKPSVAS